MSWGLVRTSALTLTALLAFAALGQAEEIAPAASETPPVSAADAPWVPTLEFGGKTGTERHLWEVDATLPIFQNETMLTFFDGRLRGDDDGSEEFNLGLAFRRIVNAGEGIVGLYGFYDLLHSGFNNTYHQATFGGEYLARGFEFRGNAYLPQPGTRSTGGGGSASGAQIVGNQIQVMAGGGERALPGFDLEGGVRLPWVEDLWLRAALFHFSASDFDDVTGPRFSAEWGIDASRIFRGAELTLGAEWQTDQIRGAQGFASVYFKVPLGAVPEKASKPSWTYDRMQTKIRRDIDIVVAKGDGSAVPALDPETGEPFGEVYFADGTSDESSTGTFEDPTDLATAYERAGEGGVVVAIGDAGEVPSSDEFAVPSGTRLLGGGSMLLVSAGSAATNLVMPGTRPTLVNEEGTAIELSEGGSRFLLRGFDVSAYDDGIYGSDVTDVTIDDVGIEVMEGSGVYLYYASGAVTLTNSRISSDYNEAFRIRNGDSGEGEPTASAPVQLLISGNTLESMDDDALDIDVYGEGSTIQIVDNLLTADSDVVDADIDAIGASFEFSGNTVDGFANDGLEVDVDYGSLAVTIADNTFLVEDAIDLQANDGGTITGTISGNVIDGESSDDPEYAEGIRLRAYYEGTVDVQVTGNTISNVGMEAIDVAAYDMGTVTALIQNNVLSNTSWYDSSSSSSSSSASASVVAESEYGSAVTVTIENNTIDDGILLRNFGEGEGDSTLTVNDCQPTLSSENGNTWISIFGDVRDATGAACEQQNGDPRSR